MLENYFNLLIDILLKKKKKKPTWQMLSFSVFFNKCHELFKWMSIINKYIRIILIFFCGKLLNFIKYKSFRKRYIISLFLIGENNKGNIKGSKYPTNCKSLAQQATLLAKILQYLDTYRYYPFVVKYYLIIIYPC